MKALKKFLRSQEARAETKKITGGVIAGIVIILVVISIFWEDANFFGILISAGILVVIGGGMFFLLRHFDELPDAF